MVQVIDPTILEGIITGVVANGLWSLIARSGNKAQNTLRSVVAKPQTHLVKTLQTATQNLVALFPGPQRDTARLEAFLGSPEVATMVRQLFATSIVRPGESQPMEDIRKGFIAALSMRLDVSVPQVESFASSVLNLLISCVRETLNQAIEENVLPAHEAQSALRHVILLDELANLKKQLAFLSTHGELDIRKVLDFESKYRDQVGFIHSHIKPPQLDSGRRVPIDEIFVAPGIIPVSPPSQGQTRSIPLSVFLSHLYRSVLLGNPGGGKSTVSAKICFDLATRYTERFFQGREITPCLVTLREYGSETKASNCSIVRFLETQARSRYQVEAPDHAFDYLLLSGRLLVIFDGLDELLDTTFRQQITLNVEAFCKLYPAVPVLVTSREVGYDQAPLNEKIVSVYRLAPFEEAQVSEYATRWFAREEDYTPDQRAQKARAFLADSDFVPDLRSNPLMLGLMCNLYRAEGYIPRNRPEVYGKCSLMLFDRWDKSRDIHVPLPFEEHIRPAMQDLAFWIHSTEQLQGGVSENELISNTTTYLSKWVFDDVVKAKVAAENFIEFCTGRAWVFTDMGTTREGERLFQFTHRTFLEYFTACYLVSTHPTPDLLSAYLVGHITQGEWDVVAQLAFQLQSKQVQGAADVLLESLLQLESKDDLSKTNVLLFAERTLEFLVPSPRVRRSIAQAALALWLSEALADERGQRMDRVLVEHVANLLFVATENRETSADEIEKFLMASIRSKDQATAAAAAELALDLTHLLHEPVVSRRASKDAADFWANVSRRVVETSANEIKEIGRQSSTVGVRCYWHDLISLSELSGIYGVAVLLVSRSSVAFRDVWLYPVGYHLLQNALDVYWGREDSGHRKVRQMRAVEELSALANCFLNSPTPWYSEHQVWAPTRMSELSKEDRRISRNDVDLPSAAFFSMFCILATEVETEKGSYMKLRNALKAVPPQLSALLLARVSREHSGGVRQEIARCGFDEDQGKFVLRWVRREINLVGG